MRCRLGESAGHCLLPFLELKGLCLADLTAVADMAFSNDTVTSVLPQGRFQVPAHCYDIDHSGGDGAGLPKEGRGEDSVPPAVFVARHRPHSGHSRVVQMLSSAQSGVVSAPEGIVVSVRGGGGSLPDDIGDRSGRGGGGEQPAPRSSVGADAMEAVAAETPPLTLTMDTTSSMTAMTLPMSDAAEGATATLPGVVQEDGSNHPHHQQLFLDEVDDIAETDSISIGNISLTEAVRMVTGTPPPPETLAHSHHPASMDNSRKDSSTLDNSYDASNDVVRGQEPTSVSSSAAAMTSVTTGTTSTTTAASSVGGTETPVGGPIRNLRVRGQRSVSLQLCR